MIDAYLKQITATHNFTFGQPRNVVICSQAQKIFFLRSKNGKSSQNCLWEIDLTNGYKEQLVVDPILISQSSIALPEAERRRRERVRESAEGIGGFSIDRSGKKIAFALGGDLYLVSSGQKIECLLQGKAVYDPRLSPDGQRLAYVSHGALYVLNIKMRSKPKVLASDKHLDITWGQADFIAAEEMNRYRGYWWSETSQYILASQVDNRPVQDCYITDPSQPNNEPVKIKYPFAGTPNAVVSLAFISVDNGKTTSVIWDQQKYPYVVDVDSLLNDARITVQSRDQKTLITLIANVHTGKTHVKERVQDPDWVELTHGLIRQLPNGKIINNKIVASSKLVVRSICGFLDDDTTIFTAWQQNEPKSWQVWALLPDGQLNQITNQPGIHNAVADESICVIATRTLERVEAVTTIFCIKNQKWQEVGSIKSLSEKPKLLAQPTFHCFSPSGIETALLLPKNYDGKTKLPVLVDSYGGPSHQSVLSASASYIEAQWFANQGFAVVITDGRGAPGRGPKWEKAIAGNLIDSILDDQVMALQTLGAKDKRLDLSRVGIRGWSFGGYLAAFAVTRYPEVFHAAIAGAPVTDWRLYDTYYSERYLGDPTKNKARYDHCSLLKQANKLSRPLLLIHGLADDNVLFAHTLQYSSALLSAGKMHHVLPLANVTHMASNRVVAENILRLELSFLRTQLSRSL